MKTKEKSQRGWLCPWLTRRKKGLAFVSRGWRWRWTELSSRCTRCGGPLSPWWGRTRLGRSVCDPSKPPGEMSEDSKARWRSHGQILLPAPVRRGRRLTSGLRLRGGWDHHRDKDNAFPESGRHIPHEQSLHALTAHGGRARGSAHQTRQQAVAIYIDLSRQILF